MARGGDPIEQVVEAFKITPSATPVGTSRNEVQILTLSAKSTTAENITITLDGDALATVAVTDQTAGDAGDTADEIAAADYSGVGTGWTAVSDGVSKVTFTSLDYLPGHQGTYSLSSATTAAGTFAQSVYGQWNKKGATTAIVYVGVSGDLDLQVGQTRVLFENVPVGWFDAQFSVMYPTTTTATNMIAGSGG